MKILVKNRIFISDAPPNIVKGLKQLLSLENPMYYTLLRMGNKRALYNIKQYFKYYVEYAGNIVVGRGVLFSLLGMLDRHQIRYTLGIETVSAPLSKPFRTETLAYRDYQVGVIEVIHAVKNGVIQLSTGWGKTIAAMKLIEETQQKTLIIVPRNSIMWQFAKDLKKFYDYDCGVIQGSQFEVKEITVASINTLIKRDIEKIKDKFGMLIVDEAHTMITDKRLKAIQSFNPDRLYGMTATPDRTDMQGKAIKFTFGPIIVQKELPQKAPQVMVQECLSRIPVTQYSEMIEIQTQDDIRNKMIIDQILEQVRLGKKVLVLCKRIAHYELLEDQIYNKCRVYKISSAENKEELQERLDLFRKGKKPFDVILGTYSMLAVGVDIPSLDTLIFAGDIKSSVLTTQSIGRILRIFDGKQDPVIIDIDDKGNKILHRQFLERYKMYKEKGWKITKYGDQSDFKIQGFFNQEPRQE